MKQIHIHKAQPVGDIFPESVEIIIKRTAPEAFNLDLWKEFTKKEAHTLADALFSSLPGGTIDALLIEMLERTRSLLVVPHRCSAPDLRLPQGPSPLRVIELSKSLRLRFDREANTYAGAIKLLRIFAIDPTAILEAENKEFSAWIINQAAAGDLEADEYLGLVNQKEGL